MGGGGGKGGRTGIEATYTCVRTHACIHMRAHTCVHTHAHSPAQHTHTHSCLALHVDIHLARTKNANALAEIKAKCDVLEHRGVRAVPKRDVVQLKAPLA